MNLASFGATDGSTGMHPLGLASCPSVGASSCRDAGRSMDVSSNSSSAASTLTRMRAQRACLAIAIAVLLAITVLARPAYSQERVRVKASAGKPATTSVPSADESMPLYTVRARIQRSGGLPVSWLMTKLLELTGARGGAAVGASIGAAIGASIGALTGIGAPIAVPAGITVGGLVGSVYAERMAELLGTLGTTDLRCGVDLDIVAPASVEDNPYGRWRLDIPFDFESARMPTATDWDSTTYVDAGSTITATAQDSLCRGAAMTVEYEYEYDCDLYCDTSDPEAVCPERCRAFEMEFVPIPAGSFLMGSRELTDAELETVPPGDWPDEDEFPQHRRPVGQFSLGKYEVTQAQWVAVMGEEPGCSIGGCDTCPVRCVSWNDTQEFIAVLNEQESGAGYRYRLPTEAEWEYAARAGTTGARYGELDAIAWYRGNSGGQPHPVGEKRANAWGLHDMLGNVWEWTADWFRSYPGAEREFDYSGSRRVLRGGSWHDSAGYVRSADRITSPGYRGVTLGFRLVRTN